MCVEVCVSAYVCVAPAKTRSLQSTSDLICRARPKRWDDSLEPAPTNSD